MPIHVIIKLTPTAAVLLHPSGVNTLSAEINITSIAQNGSHGTCTYYSFGILSFKFNLMYLPTKPNIVTSMELMHKVDVKVHAHIFFTILLY